MMRFCLIALAACVACAKKEFIQAMKHDIQEITPMKFDTVIGKLRDGSVGVLWFFKPRSEGDKEFLDKYNEIAKDLKGQVRVVAMNCIEHKEFCAKNEVTETPAIMIYPPNPMPNYLYKGDVDRKKLGNHITSKIPDLSTEITSKNAAEWLKADNTKPKVFLFTDKEKGVPTIWKSLSSEIVFRRSIKFGVVRKSESDLVTKYKVKKFPTVIMLRGAKQEKKEVYKGDMTFAGIQPWVNLYSESGMGDKVTSSAASGGEDSPDAADESPWLSQDIPELTQMSQKDVCFKGEGLCVIWLSDGPIDTASTDLMAAKKASYASQLAGRGTVLKWMWQDMKTETAFKEMYAVEELPAVIVFNPHKRLRFTKLEGQATATGIQSLIDKILGGDARFTMVKGQKLPAWANRAKAGGKKAEL